MDKAYILQVVESQQKEIESLRMEIDADDRNVNNLMEQVNALGKELEAKDKLIAEWEQKHNELSNYTNEIKIQGIREAIKFSQVCVFDNRICAPVNEEGLNRYIKHLTYTKPTLTKEDK